MSFWLCCGLLKWKKLGFYSSNGGAEFWMKYNVIDPLKAREWVLLNLNNFQYKLLLKNNISINEYKIWKNNNVAIENIIKWKKAGINKPEDALVWINAGIINPGYIANLKEIGINSVDEYKPYRNTINTSQIKILQELGLNSNNRLIKDLVKFNSMSGRVLGTWISYKNLFFKDSNTLSKRLKTLDKYYCDKLEDDYFSTADPYYNKGKCYLFGATLIQRLGKDYGLAEGLNGRTYLVSFDKPIQKGAGIIGVIMGTGNYKYTNGYGSKKNVSKGHIIIQQIQ